MSLSSSSSMGAAKIRQTYSTFVALPDWSSPMVERLDWLTDTKTAFDGTEQRIKLREWPRRAIDFAFGAGGRMARQLQAFLYGQGAREFLVPMWSDGTQLQADVVAGDLVVNTPTDGYDFQVGAHLVIVDDQGRFEAAEVGDIEDGVVTLRQAFAATWPAGCIVYPARRARFPDTQGLTRFTGEFILGRTRVELQDVSEWPEASEPTYRGLPVMTTSPDWTGNVEADFVRKLAALDFGTGVRVFDDESERPEIVQTHRWFLATRAEVAAFRSWLYSRAGKFAAVWVPTWVPDLVMTSNLGASATLLDVENIGYTRQVPAGVHRRDIRIELISGAVYYRRITVAAEVNPDVETLAIDSPLGVAVTPADIARISFIALCRLDADGVELAWFTGDAAQASTNMRATGNDV
ncbi:MAG: hypothetical protein AB7V24_16060 [Steroidobacteraceae bacterium]